MTPDTKDKASDVARKNLPKDAKVVIADAKNDITIPFYSTTLQPTDDTLIKRGGGKGLALYDEVERDTHAGSVLQKRKTTLVAREWEVKPGGDRPIDMEAADFVSEQLQRLSFDRLCEDLLDATLKGFSIGEVVWERDGSRIQPRKIVSHDQRRFVFDLEWRPRLLTLSNMNDGLELPDRKFMVHRHGVKGNNPYGLGLGSSLFWPVLFKREGVAFWLTFLDKFASPTVYAKTPYGLPDNEQVKLINTLASIVQNSAFTVPMGVEPAFLEASRSGTISYEDWCRYWDGQMSIRTLGETLTTDVGKTGGARAQSETHHDILELLVDSDADLLSSTFHETLFQWMVDYNFPGAKVPHVWRIRAADELQDAQVKERQAVASQHESKAYVDALMVAAKFDNDDQARLVIESLLPNEPSEALLDALVEARFSFMDGGERGRDMRDLMPSNQSPNPKKKDLNNPAFSEGDDDGDVIAFLTDQLMIEARSLDQRRLDDVQKIINDADSYDVAEKSLLDLYASWTVDDHASLYAQAFEMAAYAGRERVLREDETDEVSFAEFEFPGKTFSEQIDFLKNKDVRPTKRWTDVLRQGHDRAFVVAGLKDRDLLSDVQTAIVQAKESGLGYAGFQAEFNAILSRADASKDLSVREWASRVRQNLEARTRIIYDTNLRTSYMAGRYRQMTDPKLVKRRPYWQYRHGEIRTPKNPRAKHKAWDGLILKWNDPFWQTHFAPNDWRCSCGVRSLSERNLKKLGKDGPDESPIVGREPVINPKTGKLDEKTQGVGFGWDYAPGEHWARGLTPSQVEGSMGQLSFVGDQTRPIDNLIETARPFTAKQLSKDRKPEYYVDKFLEQFGTKSGEPVIFTDKVGERLLISDELFRSHTGELKALKRGHDIHAARLAETIIDPDEIWLGVYERDIPEEQGGGKERFLDRIYVRTDPETGLVAVFDLQRDVWDALTGFQPLKKNSTRTDINQINKRRGGKLLYQRQ